MNLGDVRIPTYTLKDVAKASAVSVATMKDWTTRGVFEADIEAAGKGKHARYSLLTVLRIALATRLIEMGVAPMKAASTASVWTDTSSSAGPAFGAEPNVPARSFGGLFGAPYWTVLGCGKAGAEATIHAVDPVTTKMAEAFLWFGNRRQPVLLVCLDDIDRQVREALGLEASATNQVSG